METHFHPLLRVPYSYTYKPLFTESYVYHHQNHPLRKLCGTVGCAAAHEADRELEALEV